MLDESDEPTIENGPNRISLDYAPDVNDISPYRRLIRRRPIKMIQVTVVAVNTVAQPVAEVVG